MAELDAELTTAGSGRGGCGVVLVGSKVDRLGERQVALETARELAKAHGAEHIECSSKDGTNCEAAFEAATRLMLERGLCSSSTSLRSTSNLQSSSALLSQTRSSPGDRRVGSAGCCA